jgi:D-alanine-D-alanine ligase
MRIGITFDLKCDGSTNGSTWAGAPDDLQEEFDSPVTIEAIASVLRDLGHDVEQLGDGRELLERLLADPPDFVFNFAEGQGVGRSREARVPAVLEMLGIPYSGSDPLTLAVTLDKASAKRLVRPEVSVPWDVVLPADEDSRPLLTSLAGTCPFPVIVKPAWEGSSKGIRNKCLVHSFTNLLEVVETLRQDYQQPILVEEYIQGDELTVGIVGNQPPHVLGVMRVVPVQPTTDFVYSLEIKRDWQRLVHYQCPAPLAPEHYQQVCEAALSAYRILGCRDVARVDFRLRGEVPYFLEVNPLPGLNPESSDLVIMSRLCGWSYSQLIETIIHEAIARQDQRAEVSNHLTSSH